MTTTYTTSFRLWEGQPLDPAIANAWGGPLNENMVLLEAPLGGSGSPAGININGLTTYSLTTANGAADQARALTQSYTGALTSACTVTMPNVPKVGYAQNSTTGGQNVILTAGAGTTLTIPPDGRWYFYWTDGNTNVSQPLFGYVGNLSVGGTLTVAGLLTASGGVRLPNGTFISALDQSQAPRNLIGISGSTTSVLNVGTGFFQHLTQSGGLAFSYDNSSNLYFGTSAALTPIASRLNAGRYLGSSGGLELNTTGSGAVINLGVGVANPSLFLAFEVPTSKVVGTISTNQSSAFYNTTSDERLKIDDGVIEAADAHKVLMALRPRWFRWKSDQHANSEPGFFAQQVRRVFPWAVTRGRGRPGSKSFKPWQMDNAKLIPVLVAALQDAHRRIAALERRI